MFLQKDRLFELHGRASQKTLYVIVTTVRTLDPVNLKKGGKVIPVFN
jgi:hypothetical protein